MFGKSKMECKVGRNGLDVGESKDSVGHEYTFEGEVLDGKPHGIGIKRYSHGFVYYGNFVHGVGGGGDYIVKLPSAIDLQFREWTLCRFSSAVFDRNNERHIAIMKKAEEQALKARMWAEQLWSPRTHHFIKFKDLHSVVMIVLLCAERLRNQGNSLPPEMWEIILSIFTNNHMLQ
eukprot:m.344595 g.344595  ORF g.344595 m.344595 type:complete len:176 (+) comp24737_c0_seq1:141-668(+)